MKNLNLHLKTIFLGLSLGGVLMGCAGKEKESESGTDTTASAGSAEYYTLADFPKVVKYNTHVHYRVFDSTFVEQGRKDNFKFITVNVNSGKNNPIEKQQEVAVELVKAFPDRIGYATTFSVEGFNEPGWQEKTIAYLQDSYNKGARSVKIWKNVGLELKDANGKFVMIDDPKFDPILDFMEKNKMTLIGHIGEPKNAWLPVEKMTVKGDKNYFSEHPQYHMYLHKEYPTHEQIIAARDHMLEKHPNLMFVGAHLGSLEWDTNELAKRLDKFPNMAVDMAERISHFQYQAVTDWKKVHDFFIKYQDRLIYATDESVSGTIPMDTVNRRAHENWVRHWNFFTSAEKMKVPKVEKEFAGLHLPKEAVDKIYRKNTEKWFPGYTALMKEDI